MYLRALAIVCCIGLLAVISTSVLAQPIEERQVFHRLPVNDALSQNTITDILQDRRGLMWFATLGGLDVYDGYRFRTIPSDPREQDALSGVHVSRLYEDRAGNIWVAGFNGWLDRIEPGSGRIHHYSLELYGDPQNPSSGATAFHETAAGNLLIGTATGLHRYDAARDVFVRNIDREDGSDGMGRIWHMIPAAEGRVWIGANSGLYRYDPESGARTRIHDGTGDAEGLPGAPVTRLLLDSQERLWAASGSHGLARLDPGAAAFIHYRADDVIPNTIGSDVSVDMMEDSHGRIWIANQSGGLSRFVSDEQGFEVYRHDPNNPATISSNDVWSLHEDRTGLIWIGTAGGGLNQINPSRNRFGTLRSIPFNDNSLRSGFVWDFAEDAAGDIWMATLAGLEHYSPGSDRFRHFAPDPDSVAANQMQSVAMDADGYIWAGAVDGSLFRFNPGDETFKEIFRDDGPANVFDSGRIWLLFPHGDLMWVGGVTGLYAISIDSLEVTDALASDASIRMGGNPIRSMTPAPDGGYWIGSAGAGLARYVPGEGVVQHFLAERGNPQSLSNNVVRALHMTDAGDLWVGTLNGLNFITRDDLAAGRNRFELYSVADGLPNNTVYGIEPDGFGYLWLSTNRGLSRFDPDAGVFDNFTVADGLPSNEFNGGAELQTRDGHLYLGGVAGITIVHAHDLPHNHAVPEVLITGVSVGGKPLAEFAEVIRVPPDISDISIEFAVTDYHQPEKNAFEYRLLGASDEWRASDQRLISFDRLAPGDYLFEVRGSNNDGIWSDNVARVDIRVLPPFWRSTAAYIVYVGLLLAGLVLYHLIQRRRLARQERFNRTLRRAHSLAEANRQMALRYAQYDQLTQLPNRTSLLDTLGRHMRHAAAGNRRLGLLLINIDRFQRINDSFGHAVGDRVLKTIAERLQSLVAEGDSLARVGPDEFVWVTEMDSAENTDHWAAARAESINQVIGEPIDLQDPPIVMTASVGCGVYEGGPESASDVLGFADIALHKAKELPDRSVLSYDPSMSRSVRQHITLEGRIKRALESGEFSAEYQPLVSVANGQLQACEALIRWFPPGGEPVFPDQFIPVAEQSGLIVDIGNWMIRHVCGQLAAWGEINPPGLQIALNVSMRQLRSGTLVPTLRAALAEFGVAPSALKIEITESAMMENVDDAAEQLQEVSQLGIDISVDDFGTGFSSLSHLKLLPVSELKIDRSFVMDLMTSSDSRTIVKSIVRLAHEMNLRAVAEGVEDEQSLALLAQMGCDLAQGYHFARPLTAEALVADGWIRPA